MNCINITKNPNIKNIEKYFDFYTIKLKPYVVQFATQNLDGMHGINTHTNAVVFRGIDYALSLDKNPLPVVFACAFHDMARTHDMIDSEHGKYALPMATKIMKTMPIFFDKDTEGKILDAVANHTSGVVAPDYISACLWDADRTRLAWQYGFNPKYFNTERGKYVAGGDAWKYIEFQRKNFPEFTWDREY